MPYEVDFKHSDARFENGLLTIKVPVAGSMRGGSIEIH
jgi:HSP20 family molecular chaperone IbpA